MSGPLTPERIAFLRQLMAAGGGTKSTMAEVLDAYEALAKERDRYREALEEIAPQAKSACDCCEFPGSIASRALEGEKT